LKLGKYRSFGQSKKLPLESMPILDMIAELKLA